MTQNVAEVDYCNVCADETVLNDVDSANATVCHVMPYTHPAPNLDPHVSARLGVAL